MKSITEIAGSLRPGDPCPVEVVELLQRQLRVVDKKAALANVVLVEAEDRLTQGIYAGVVSTLIDMGYGEYFPDYSEKCDREAPKTMEKCDGRVK